MRIYDAKKGWIYIEENVPSLPDSKETRRNHLKNQLDLAKDFLQKEYAKLNDVMQEFYNALHIASESGTPWDEVSATEWYEKRNKIKESISRYEDRTAHLMVQLGTL